MVGTKHGNSGKTPYNKTPQQLESEVKSLLKNDYYDFMFSPAQPSPFLISEAPPLALKFEPQFKKLAQEDILGQQKIIDQKNV